ncbi:hypothetical protein [Microbispora sp. H11081]|nr:hypothetical protein [Microbispora sp. H11081]
MRTVVVTGGTDGIGPRASSPADARRLCEYTQNLPAERQRSSENIEVSER